MSLRAFLKSVDQNLYLQYQMENFQDNHPTKELNTDFSSSNPVFNKKTTFDIPTIESLPNDHFAKVYVLDRKIPKEHWKELYFAEDFARFVKESFPDCNKTLFNEPRLIIPFYDEKYILQGIQGRALSKSNIRYITIKTSTNAKKIFGLNTLDMKKTIYVVEGIFDSLFLPNSIATMDSALYRAIKLVGYYDYVFVFDNERRNSAIIDHMKKTIDLGEKICLWPKHIKEKDINDIILSGRTPTEIQNIIDKNTFSGIRATLELETWKKI